MCRSFQEDSQLLDKREYCGDNLRHFLNLHKKNTCCDLSSDGHGISDVGS